MQTSNTLTKSAIENILKNIPTQSGVYRYYGTDGNLLYVGKAKNLKNRVSNYFQNNKLENNPRLQLMVSQIEKIEYTVVDTEKEALILEANLIYNLQPKYNILLKDDKSYLYVRITADPIPKITLTRRKYDKKSQYYGPYTKKYGIFNILRILRIIFPYCDGGMDSKPCHYVQIKQCDGICCGKETIEQYQTKIQQIKNVLSGDTKPVKTWLKSKMLEAISMNNFELASLWRDKSKMLDDVVSNQKIIFPHPQDLDIITIIIEQDAVQMCVGSVFVQNIREGKIININNFLMTGSGDQIESTQENEIKSDIKSDIKNQPKENINIQNFAQTFLINYYAEQSTKPEILLNIYQNS